MIKLGLILIACYLIGSVPFGYLLAKTRGVDIREHGSGNIGATNVWRTIGPSAGLTVLILDALKGFAAVYIGRLAGIDNFELFSGMASLIGHAFPIYLGFKGGKIIATGAGVMFALAPLVTTIAVLIFAVIVAGFRYVSLGSIVAALSVPVSLFLFDYSHAYLAFGVVVAAFAVIKHIPNIKRLMAGTESRITFGKK
ncbi:MAG: glycerol-3-phosphate 1-O-acyltransferase PlsY [Bacillota bacterium]